MAHCIPLGLLLVMRRHVWDPLLPFSQITGRIFDLSSNHRLNVPVMRPPIHPAINLCSTPAVMLEAKLQVLAADQRGDHIQRGALLTVLPAADSCLCRPGTLPRRF